MLIFARETRTDGVSLPGTMETAVRLVEIVEYYLMIGAVVAVLFLVIGIERVEPGARGAYAFRPLLVPGLCLLWPIVLIRWWQIERKNRSEW